MAKRNVVPTPFTQRLRRARVGALPFVMWVAAVLVALQLWLAGPRASVFHGMARGHETEIALPLDGKLDQIHVSLFETVDVGMPLATIDDAEMVARIQTAKAELQRLSAELETQYAEIEAENEAFRRLAQGRFAQVSSVSSLEFPAELRAFHADEARLDLNILETRLALTTSELEADRIEVQMRRAQSLRDERIGTVAAAEDLEKRYAKEYKRVESLRLIEANLEAELESARQRRQELIEAYALPPSDTLIGPIQEARLAAWRAAILVQQERMNELNLQREAYLLRAPCSGRVAALVAAPGQYMLAGEPILVLVDPCANEVALWVPESSATAPGIGDRFLVSLLLGTQPTDSAECVVQSLGPRIEEIPQRLWRDLRVPEYGRACLIGPIASLGTLPGEKMRIDPLPAIP